VAAAHTVLVRWRDAAIHPEELSAEGKSLPAAGTLFVGDAGMILNNELIPAKKMQDYRAAKGLPEPQPRPRETGIGLGADWVAAVKGGPASGGNFISAANCAEAIALAQAAIRYSRKTFRANQCAPALLWNAQAMEFTNASDANQYLGATIATAGR
jgi:hypothetical protein